MFARKSLNSCIALVFKLGLISGIDLSLAEEVVKPGDLKAIPSSSFAGLKEKFSILSDIGSVPSPYRDKLKSLIATWPKSVSFQKNQPAKVGEADIEIQCYETLNNPTYIGVAQRMVVAAPFERVVSVVDDYGKYVGIFEGLKKVNSISVDENRVVTAWEEEIPFPLVPNEHNQMIHLVSNPHAGLKIYRYGLKESNHLTRNDGFIVLEAGRFGETVYTEFDFFDADWGIAKSFGVDRLWKGCLEGLYQSDFALKLRAEHGNWSAERVLETSNNFAKALSKQLGVCSKREFPIMDSK